MPPLPVPPERPALPDVPESFPFALPPEFALPRKSGAEVPLPHAPAAQAVRQVMSTKQGRCDIRTPSLPIYCVMRCFRETNSPTQYRSITAPSHAHSSIDPSPRRAVRLLQIDGVPGLVATPAVTADEEWQTRRPA